jgi:signal transduction histidine kinase
MKLSRRLLVIVLLCLIPTVAAQVYVQLELHRERARRIDALATRRAELAGAAVASTFDSVDQILAAVALELENTPPPTCSKRLDQLQRGLSNFVFLAALDADGRTICASGAATQPRVQAAIAQARPSNGFRVGLYGVIPGSGVGFLPLTRPVRSGPATNGPVMLFAALDPAWLTRRLRRMFPGCAASSDRDAIEVLDRAGTIVARCPDRRDLLGKPAPPAIRALAQRLAAGVAPATLTRDGDRIAGYVQIGAAASGMATVASLRETELGPDLTKLTISDAALTAASILLALCLTSLAGRRFVGRPMGALLAAARRWRAGDLAARTGLGASHSEFGMLGTTFDDMAGALEAREQERREQAEMQEALIAERTRKLSESNNRLQVEMAERARTEAVLNQTQKLQAVGQLASGIAHDFNNMLATVLGSLELMERRVTDPERLHALIQRASGAVERGAQLTSRLLAFSRRQRLAARPTDLNRLVLDLIPLIASTVGRGVRVTTDLAADLPPAMVDPSQIEAALVNLALNARDAMPQGGTLRIASGEESLRERPTQEDPETGEYVRLVVSDTGLGMVPDVLRRAFEPFFTTKGPTGTGLGLSQVYGVARQSGGLARLESAPGEGTTITLLLPQAVPDASARPAPLVPEVGRRPTPPLLVLVVDDDPAVRQVTADMVRELGCQVLEAADGAEALALLQGPAAGIDLLVVDYAMPGMNGLELADAARARGLTTPIILATGYAELGGGEHGEVLLDAVLRKPFSTRELRSVIGRVQLRQEHESNVVRLRQPKLG